MQLELFSLLRGHRFPIVAGSIDSHAIGTSWSLFIALRLPSPTGAAGLCSHCPTRRRALALIWRVHDTAISISFRKQLFGLEMKVFGQLPYALRSQRTLKSHPRERDGHVARWSQDLARRKG
jgi:hypothetical protein